MTAYPVWKRSIDLAASTAILVAVSPLCALALIAVWLEDRKNPIFRQERIGEDAALIRVAKIRTMKAGSPNAPSADAPTTITRVGTLLRRLNIDEIPQLVSVLKGDMALVGPRPCLPMQTELQERRTASGASACRPGLTGWTQINSYDGMTIAHKADLDGEYARRMSLAFDMRIILATPLYFLHPPPKY